MQGYYTGVDLERVMCKFATKAYLLRAKRAGQLASALFAKSDTRLARQVARAAKARQRAFESIT